MNSGHAYPSCVQTRENPPYKGGCLKIGLDRKGEMNQNTPNPGVALRWPHPCYLPIEWGSKGCPLNVNLRPGVVLDIQVWLPARDGDGKCRLLAEALWLTPEESAWQRLWRRQRHHNQIGKTRGYRHSHHQSPHAFSGIFVCGSGRSPVYWSWSLIKINSFHNNIWFDCENRRHKIWVHIILVAKVKISFIKNNPKLYALLLFI